jgi:hypothetical protein
MYKTLKRLRVGVALLLTTLVLVGAYGTASAHYVYEQGWLYYSGDDCSWGRSEVSHGIGFGYSKSDLNAHIRSNTTGNNCGDTFQRPPGFLTVRQYYIGHFAPGWGTCKDTGWLLNTNNTWTMTVARTHPYFCGKTYYQTDSSMHVYNGGWKGASLLSGMHYIYGDQ